MICAIVQARMGSSRLPGKVMKELAGQPMIGHVLRRVAAAQRIERVMLATTTSPEDAPLAAYAESLGVGVYRGSTDDVLDRYYQAARAVGAGVVVRLTGDCPVLDPAVIDATIGLFQSGNYDYVNNFMQRSYPDGLDTEVFSMAALEIAWRDAALPSEREHVTPYFYKNPLLFKQVGLVQPFAWGDWRWTVDEPADFDFIAAVYAALYAENPLFGMAQLVALLENQPALRQINAGIGVNEGYLKSLQED